MAERPKKCSETEFRLLDGYCTPSFAADKIGFGTWRDPHGIPRKQKVKCVCSEWTSARRWTKHMAKTPITQAAKDDLVAKTAKKNAAGKKRKGAKAIELAKEEWVRDLSDEDSDEDSSDADEQEDAGDEPGHMAPIPMKWSQGGDSRQPRT